MPTEAMPTDHQVGGDRTSDRVKPPRGSPCRKSRSVQLAPDPIVNGVVPAIAVLSFLWTLAPSESASLIGDQDIALSRPEL
jgi:hypothetical protein